MCQALNWILNVAYRCGALDYSTDLCDPWWSKWPLASPAARFVSMAAEIPSPEEHHSYKQHCVSTSARRVTPYSMYVSVRCCWAQPNAKYHRQALCTTTAAWTEEKEGNTFKNKIKLASQSWGDSSRGWVHSWQAGKRGSIPDNARFPEQSLSTA